ncbi:MAG: 4Fe-4S dicluster domain-containing protein [Candidatus Aegiribacteria sp.]|nr:4Fe-4S dicluster domain-containing protein [Candidatus Aegiribacteria sp.]
MSESRKYPFPEIDSDICKGCKLCIEACPTNVLVISEKLNSKGFHYAEYIGEGCVGCGNCFYTCPEPSAVTVYLKDYVPEEVS